MQAVPSATGMKNVAAAVSLLFNLLQTVLKLSAAIVTGSVSLLSEAVHSSTDVVASALALVSVRAAALPPDEEHPYGHGKIESLTAFAEAIVLGAVVAFVMTESVLRLTSRNRVENVDLGLAVVAATSVGGLLVGLYVKSVGRKTGSMALLTNGQHLTIDFWSSVTVLAALVVVKTTGWHQADGVFALGMGGWMLFNAWRMGRAAFDQLIDHRLADADIDRIHEIIVDEGSVISHHRLRSRLSGNVKYIDFHIVVPADWSLVQAHELADTLEKRLASELAPAQVVIHVDPYDDLKALASPS